MYSYLQNASEVDNIPRLLNAALFKARKTKKPQQTSGVTLTRCSASLWCHTLSLRDTVTTQHPRFTRTAVTFGSVSLSHAHFSGR